VKPRIPVAGPWITEREVEYVTRAVREAWYDQAGMFHQPFEAAFATFTGRRFAMALPSCTSALHLALAALGIGPGDEVIVPEITWIATAAPITYLGATPVFADIDPGTWCLSAASAAEHLTPRTRAIIAVDLYGQMPDMDALRRLAEAHGIALLEDAAQAVGSTYRGRPAGSFGEVSAFSFHGSKTLTTGEGGMWVTDREDLHARALALRDHGRPPGDRLFFNAEVAYKYRMSAMQAALGLAQLERVDELVAKKREIFGWYERALQGVEGVSLNRPGPDVEGSYWMVTVLLDPRFGLEKAELMRRFAEENIDTRPFFHPLSSLPAYRGLPGVERARERNPVSHALSPYGINLPSALVLTAAQVARVCDCLKRALTS
jgi:perosamine synthetase